MSGFARILLGATASHCGKTTITCAILQALKNRGLQTVSFKCGPDYLDPLFHRKAIGVPSWNLDPFFTPAPVLNALFQEHAAGMDFSVIEGVMGYFDGLGGTSLAASTCEVARITDTPAVLILPCKGMSRSAVAMAKGYLEYARPNQLQGVILNQLSPMLYPALRDQIETELGVRVYGYFPSREEFVLPGRHLGLIPAHSLCDVRGFLEELAKQAEESLDLDGLLVLGRTAPKPNAPPICLSDVQKYTEPPRIAVAQDDAFCFLYRDNLCLLEKLGAKLSFFSPLNDRTLPPCDGLILPGGYPELYAKALSQNNTMKQGIHDAVQNGLPCIAECGGFLYLHESLTDSDGHTFPMVGVIPSRAYPCGHLKRFGYVRLTAQHSQLLCGKGEHIPAHEFHYWESDAPGNAYLAVKPTSQRSWECVHGTPTLYAGFPHLYFYANPRFAARFFNACCQYHQQEESRDSHDLTVLSPQHFPSGS